MRRVPMSAREQLLLAHERGHDLEVHQRGPWPELGDPHPKYYLRCSCGYVAATRRSKKALNSAMVWHLGKVIAEGIDSTPKVAGS